MKRVEVAIVGGGLLGLAAARSLGQAGLRDLIVLEAETEVALHQSGRNSGVVHSGLYYTPGSWKARACTEGRELLHAFCRDEGVALRRTGKLVVASTQDQVPRLEALRDRGVQNGLDDPRMLDPNELRALEPRVRGSAALLVRETALVDFREVARALARRIHEQGGEVRTGVHVRVVDGSSGGLRIGLGSGEVEARLLLNCAGLQSDRVARLCRVRPPVRIVPFRGEYFRLRPDAGAVVSMPVYPVPDPRLPFLGVHLHPTPDGGIEVGPNAVLSLGRHRYGGLGLSVRDVGDVLLFSGFWRLAARHAGVAVAEVARTLSRRRFVAAARTLVPSLRVRDLGARRRGIRAQAVTPRGDLVDDFLLLGGPRSLHLLNAPSPAATSCLALASRIRDEVLERL